MNTIELIIKFHKGPQKMADAQGISIQRVINWRARGQIPADCVLDTSKATHWQITPHQIRPDIYPNPTDGLPPREDAA